MARDTDIRPEFVEFVPDTLEQGVLYISCQNLAMIHLCCCGCGNQVVTPLSPTGWELRYDGRGVTLYPSIGNWKLRCQSHYWIRNNKVRWAGRLSKAEIADHYASNARLRERYFRGDFDPDRHRDWDSLEEDMQPRRNGEQGLWKRLKRWMT